MSVQRNNSHLLASKIFAGNRASRLAMLFVTARHCMEFVRLAFFVDILIKGHCSSTRGHWRAINILLYVHVTEQRSRVLETEHFAKNYEMNFCLVLAIVLNLFFSSKPCYATDDCLQNAPKAALSVRKYLILQISVALLYGPSGYE